MLKHRILIVVIGTMLLYACKHEAGEVAPAGATYGNYPAAIGKIMESKCAVQGCHNAASYTGAGGLLLDSWEHMFDGSNNGAVVIAYSPIFSSLLYFINTNEDSGLVAEPRMPVNGEALSAEEYKTIKDWIAAGAPDAKGNIPFADNPDTRQKIYAIQQDCDVLTVIDAEKKVVMRYVPMGRLASQESMSDLQISPDGNYLYVSYWFSNFLQKVDTRTDKVVAETDLGDVFWGALYLSDDGSRLVVSNDDAGTLSVIDAGTMQMVKTYKFDMERPRNIVASSNFETLYATSRTGNVVYKIANDSLHKISIDGKAVTTEITANTPNPWDLVMAPDFSKYFIACSQTNDVRVVSTTNDEVLKVIPVGATPQQMAMSDSKPYLFVTCLNDPASGAKSKGSVYAINYETLEIVKRIEAGFYEPYGVSVDDKTGSVYVISKNLTSDGPAPHHGSPCDGRNGFYQVIDLNTLNPVSNKRHEILTNPTATQIRF